MAAEELLKEAKQLAEFADKEGPSAWKTRRIGKTNKVFLRQTLGNAISSNKYKDRISRTDRKMRK